MIKTTTLITLILLSLFSCRHTESNEFEPHKTIDESQFAPEYSQKNKVVGIKDGDTFVILIEGKEQVVRLEHIDCPEKKQPFGSKAKQFASDLCFGKYVQLNHNNKLDRNKRLIAEVILENGVNINKELVSSGLAWHFKKYSNNSDYSELEIKARTSAIGIWSEPNPIAPWEWRRK